MKKLLTILLLGSVLCGYAKVGFDAEKIKDYVFLDLRSLKEASVEHLDSTSFVPSCILPYDENFKSKTELLEAYKGKTLLLFCRSGRRAGLAKGILEKADFENVENLKTLASAREFEAKIRNHLYPLSDEEILEKIVASEKAFGIDVITPLKARDYEKLYDILMPRIGISMAKNTQIDELTDLLTWLCYYVQKNDQSSYYLGGIDLSHPYGYMNFCPSDTSGFAKVMDFYHTGASPDLLSPEDRKVYDQEYELYKQFQAEMKQANAAKHFSTNMQAYLIRITEKHKE